MTKYITFRSKSSSTKFLKKFGSNQVKVNGSVKPNNSLGWLNFLKPKNSYFYKISFGSLSSVRLSSLNFGFGSIKAPNSQEKMSKVYSIFIIIFKLLE